MDQLSGKTAVVTGAASGMGRSFALRFARAEMNVVVADVDLIGLAKVADEVRALGVSVLEVETDVRFEASIQALCDAAIDAFGQVNVVCNNAGVASRFMGGAIDVADWQWVMDVNFWSVVYGHKVFLPHLLSHGDGHIINTASMAGHFPSHSPYGASKWAVVGITEGLFHELAERQSTVGVSCLCPGWVQTRIADTMDRPAVYGVDAKSPPRVEDPEEAARYAFVRNLVENGLSPDAVADLVHDSILAKQFWILTHPEMVAMLPARYDAILTGQNPKRSGLS